MPQADGGDGDGHEADAVIRKRGSGKQILESLIEEGETQFADLECRVIQ
jgi:hypothetical protein